MQQHLQRNAGALERAGADIHITRGAESSWGCSDSGLLIHSDYGSDSDSGFDGKYEINNTLTVQQVSAVRAKKERDVSY